MSVKLMEQVFRDARIDGGSELNVMLALADEVRDGLTCWPSMETIARKSRMTGRGARNVIRKLETKGLLRRMPGGGRANCNRYVLLLNAEQVSENTETNPEPQSRNDIPSKGRNPEICDHKPGTAVPPNRNEPSSSSSSDARALVMRVIEAAGADRRQLTAYWCGPGAEVHVNRWRDDLGIPEHLILETVEAESRRHSEPATGPKAFDGAMRRLAGSLHGPKLQPIEGGRAPPPQAIDFEKIWASGGKQ